MSSAHGLPSAADHVDPESAGRLVAWAAALAAGKARLDEAASAIEGGSDGHVVEGLPGATSDVPVVDALALLRRSAVRAVTLVLPVAGDPLGCGDVSPFTNTAVLAGQGVAIESDVGCVGWVPEPDLRGSSYRGVRWRVHLGSAVNPALTMTPDRIIEQADRALRRALREATETLGTLDLAQWRTEAAAGRAAADIALRSRVRSLPAGWPPAARELGQRALALWRVLRVASADSGAASASASTARTQALRPLSRAVREAAMVAFNVPAAALLSPRGSDH